MRNMLRTKCRYKYLRNVGTSKTVGTGKNVPLRIIWLNSKGTYLPSSTLGEMKWMINAEKNKNESTHSFMMV